jgi:hypothetical protein
MSVILALTALPLTLAASDTDSPPFLIYVDPVTGKYTQKKPEHESTPQQSSSDTKTSRQLPPVTQIFPAFLIAGGLLLGSHLLSRILVSVKKA